VPETADGTALKAYATMVLMDYRRTFRASAVLFVDLVSRLPEDRWESPALGEWNLRDLVGHTVSSGLRQVPAVLATPATEIAVDTPEGYFALSRSVPPEVYAAAVAASSADARAVGLTLDPGELAGRATQALAAAGDDDIVTTPGGGMRVRDWIPTRTLELVVHGMDIARAAEVEVAFPAEAIGEATLLSARLAVKVGDGAVLLNALTGRASLPEKFSVL
jgi:mycothiol maleylpyruvate isomerase-like protein